MKNNRLIKVAVGCVVIGAAIAGIAVSANTNTSTTANVSNEKSIQKVTSFNDFKALVPEIAKMEDTPFFHLGDKVSEEDLKAKKFVLDKEQGNVKFYKYSEPEAKFLDVPVNLIAAIVEGGHVNGLVVQFKGEENKIKLQEALTSKLGAPASEGQENTVMKVFWGKSLPESAQTEFLFRDVRPVSLTFDFYVQDGFLFWENPNQLFKKKK